MANEYWEKNLKNMNHQKIQDDENALTDFIRDKYERRRYAPSKKKDPMALIYEGKDPQPVKKEEEEFVEVKEDEEQ
jgi:hypothetical protein